MKIILSVILFTWMQTPALARILQRKEILPKKEILQKKEVRHPPVDVKSTIGDGNQKQVSSSRTHIQTKNVDQQRMGNNNNNNNNEEIEETKECIPFDDPRAAASAFSTQGTCKNNICNGGCCRYHTAFLTCDKKNDFPHQECICNNLTDNTHLETEDFFQTDPTDPPTPLTDPLTDPPTPAPTVTPCTDLELDFSFFITTDSYASETSWALQNSQGEFLASGDNLINDRTYNTQKCIPNDCYTLYIDDTAGDGMCCGLNPSKTTGYKLTVDGSVLQAEFGIDVNFGNGTSFNFGSCEEPTLEPILEPDDSDNKSFQSDSGDCMVDIEMVCDDIIDELPAVPSLYNVDLEESLSSQLVDCELTVYGNGENDIHLTALNMFSNVFEDLNMFDALDGGLLTPDMTYAVEFTIEIDLTISQKYKFFSTVIGNMADGVNECFASTFLEFTAGNHLS